MKHLLFAAAFSALLLQACSGDTKTNGTEDIVPANQTALDLTPQGFPVKINIPDSTVGFAQVTETPGGVEITVGPKFDILVNTAAPEDMDMKQQKALAQTAMDGAKVTFSVDSDTTLVWQTAYPDVPAAYHFYMLKKIGTDTYYVRDNNQNSEQQFTEAEISRMRVAARSLRNKPAETPAK